MSIFASPVPQLFSIPYNFLLYITENPASHEVLEKLYQTCKFFFAENPILICPNLICAKGMVVQGEGEITIMNDSVKYWAIKDMIIFEKIDQNKFYRCSPKAVNVLHCPCLLPEFVTAENSITKLVLLNASPMKITFDAVFEKLPNAVSIFYYNPGETFSLKTLKNLNSIERKQKLEFFRIVIPQISEDFVPSLLAIFMQKNGNSESKFIFDFLDLSDTKDAFVVEMEKLKTENGYDVFKVQKFDGAVSVNIL